MTKEMAINILRGDVLGTNEQTHEAVFMAIKALKEQAQVDAVEVVRCIECRYYGTITCPVNYRRIESRGRFKTFCSWGERRKDE